MAWFSNTVHPNVTHIGRPERFAPDTAVHDHLKAVGRENFFANLKEIDGLLAGRQWILGGDFSVVDGYALVFYGWGKRTGLPVAELANYTAWKDRMLARPAVRRSSSANRASCCGLGRGGGTSAESVAGRQPATKLWYMNFRSWVSCGVISPSSTRASRLRSLRLISDGVRGLSSTMKNCSCGESSRCSRR